MDYDLLSFVLRSKRRKDILKALSSPKTPTDIAREVRVSVAHVSRTLKEFMEKGLVECKTPDAKMGRIYELTKAGEGVRKATIVDKYQ